MEKQTRKYLLTFVIITVLVVVVLYIGVPGLTSRKCNYRVIKGREFSNTKEPFHYVNVPGIGPLPDLRKPYEYAGQCTGVVKPPEPLYFDCKKKIGAMKRDFYAMTKSPSVENKSFRSPCSTEPPYPCFLFSKHWY